MDENFFSIVQIKISIILVLHNNLEWFNYFENKINQIREKYNYDFDFYIYENNSNIEFKKRLKDFMIKSKGKLLSEDTDFYLNTQINKEDKYLFLYRTNITRLLEAEYRLKVYQGILDNDIESIKKSKLMSKEEPVGYGNPPSDFKIDYKDKEVQKGFENALINRSFGSRDTHVYYFKMYDKWLNSEQENVLPINYSYYTNNFVETFTKILSFFEIPINIEIIKEVSKLVHKEYDYYDDEDGEILYKIIKDNIKT